MVAEDNSLNCLIIIRLVQTIVDIPVVRAKNRQEAVEYCEKYPDITVVLMDIKMPVMDGYEVTRCIKKRYPEIPVIAQTAHALTENKEKIPAHR